MSLQPFSVMFHHFHGGIHEKTQGSISATELSALIVELKQAHSLIDAGDYVRKMEAGTLAPNEICLTFDDGLLNQFDIARPVLDAHGVRAFFFVYSSVMEGLPDYLEVYRYFRTTFYPVLNDFYRDFNAALRGVYPDLLAHAESTFNEKEYLTAFPFYSREDKWFRYLRDQILRAEEYTAIMSNMMQSLAFSPHSVFDKLWMSDRALSILHEDGHVLGLHSYSHPTVLHRLPREAQEREYRQNYRHLQNVTGVAPVAMSHPCGNYGEETLGILRDLGVKVGFRSNIGIPTALSALEVPREDHTNLMKQLFS